MERYPFIGDTHNPGIFVPDVPVQGLKRTADGRTFSHYTWSKRKYCEADSHHCVCTIQLVLDDAPEDKLLQKGNRFYLYHNYGFAATGTIS